MHNADAQQAEERLVELCKREVETLFWQIAEMDVVGWGAARLELTSGGPLIRLRGDYSGEALRRLLEAAGELDVELMTGELVYSCPSWPDTVPFA